MRDSPASSSARRAPGMVLCRLSTEKLRQAALARHQQRAGHGRRRRLEADADQHELALGLGGGELEGVGRRVDDAHVGAGGALGGQTAVRARHAHEVAEGDDGDLGQARQGDHHVEVADRGHADRTARAGDQAHAGRQQVAQAVARDRPWCGCRRPP